MLTLVQYLTKSSRKHFHAHVLLFTPSLSCQPAHVCICCHLLNKCWGLGVSCCAGPPEVVLEPKHAPTKGVPDLRLIDSVPGRTHTWCGYHTAESPPGLPDSQPHQQPSWLSNNLRPKSPRRLCSYLWLPDQGTHELKSELYK
ncbi:hypothetical protein AMECASPLE_009919 [Ameca splendens]|uniref:Uncharacterized protein n=1 Tax=Ameca splendens TaxID=208324 RepID=A0ABV1A9V7_9TELE